MIEILVFEDERHAVLARPVLRRLPRLAGEPLRITSVRGLRDRRGDVHGGSFLRERRMALSCTRAEFGRIFVHELFHFAWVRAGNPVRRGYEDLLAHEFRSGAAGELGWSAEWRKKRLLETDVARRTRRWREYTCESFCDTAAWIYSGLDEHEEFTLVARCRRGRALWFAEWLDDRALPI